MPAKYKYTFDNSTQGTLTLKNEPLEWESLELTFKRSKDFEGVTKSFSQDLRFWGDGNDYIRVVYLAEGINASIDVTVEVFDFATYSYSNLLLGRINFTNYEEELTDDSLEIVTTNIESSLFEQQVIGGADLEVNLFKLEDRFGGTITPFTNYEDVQPSLNGQVVTDSFVSTQAANLRAEFFNIEDFSFADTRLNFFNSFSITEDAKSKLQINIPEAFVGQAIPFPIWTVVNTAEGTIDIDIEYYVKIELFTGVITALTTQFVVVSSIFGNLFNESETSTISSGSLVEDTLTRSISITRTFAQGEQISFYTRSALQTDGSTTEFQNHYTQVNSYEFSIVQNNVFRATLPLGMFPFEMFSRIINHLTGEPNRVIGDVISKQVQDFNAQPSDGEASKILNVSGLGLRNFPKSESPIVVTLADCFSTYNYGFGIGLGFVSFGGNETVLIDTIDKFYTEDVILTITQGVKNPRLTSDSSRYWTNLKFGFSKYKIEDRNFQSSQEYNTQRSYNSAVEVLNNTETIFSPYIGAGYGIEYQRQEQWFESADNSSPDGKRFDDDKFLLCLTENTIASLTSRAEIINDPLTFWLRSTFGGGRYTKFAGPSDLVETDNEILYDNGEAAYQQTVSLFVKDSGGSGDLAAINLTFGGRMYAYPDDDAYTIDVDFTTAFSVRSNPSNINELTMFLNRRLVSDDSLLISDSNVFPTPVFDDTLNISLSDTFVVNPADPAVYWELVLDIQTLGAGTESYSLSNTVQMVFTSTTTHQFQEFKQESITDYFGPAVDVGNLANAISALNFRISPFQSIQRHLNTLRAVNTRLNPNQLTFSGDPIGNVLVNVTSNTSGTSGSENDNILTNGQPLYENEILEFETEWSLNRSQLVDANRYGRIIINTPDIQFDGYIEEIVHKVEDNEATVRLKRKGLPRPATPVLDTAILNVTNPQTAADLTWSHAGDNTGFLIQRNEIPPLTNWVNEKTVGTGVLATTLSDLTPNRNHRFRVIALLSGVQSDFSNELNVTTDPVTVPTLVSAVKGANDPTTEIDFTWTHVGNEDGFQLQRLNDAQTLWIDGPTVGTGLTTYTWTGLTPNTIYDVRMRALYNGALSAPSNEINVTTDP